MNYSIDSGSIKEQVKVHTGGGRVKVVVRVTGFGQQSFFEAKREVRIYTRTLVLSNDMRIKKIYEDTNGDCWWTDVSTAKRLADKYGRREGQKIVLVDSKDEELAEALRELERIVNRRPKPAPRPAPQTSSRTSKGAIIGAIIGTIIGGAVGSATEE